MKDIQNYCLRDYNTFKIDVRAQRFISFDNNSEFVEFVNKHRNVFSENFLIIGQGSNLLFTEDFNGTIIHPETKSIRIINENEDSCFIQSEAGVIWDDFVSQTLGLKAYGLENLSLIPGTVGASVVQNIGAYGVEAGDFVHSVKYFCLEDFVIKTLNKEECQFAYRNSIFKNKLKQKAIVLSVDFMLTKNPDCNIDYTDIRNYFGNEKSITPELLRDAVINIRNKKLPDPDVTGNAGSFFKNPVINKQTFNQLKIKFPELRYYEMNDGTYKVAAGWMIDTCGLKEFEYNGAAVHENQALVLINKSGNATGKAIIELANIVKDKVFLEYGLVLEPEVIIM